MKKHAPLLLILTLAAAIVYSSCSTNIQRDGSGVDAIDPIYQKEGFISRDLFRVVIVADKNTGHNDFDSIKDTARKRSLATLQKYIQTNQRTLTQNTRAELLNLIDTSGKLIQRDDISKRNKVFFFDIEKSDIRRYIDSISAR